MNIKTECHGWDNWLAFDPEADKESDSYCVGYGHSEGEAIADMMQQVGLNVSYGYPVREYD
jgi:hypothetical protein